MLDETEKGRRVANCLQCLHDDINSRNIMIIMVDVRKTFHYIPLLKNSIEFEFLIIEILTERSI